MWNFHNDEEVLTYIEMLKLRIEKYEKQIVDLEMLIYYTMKKPIEVVDYSEVIYKWINKSKSIKQRNKGIKRLQKNIYRFNSEIEYITNHYLNK